MRKKPEKKKRPPRRRFRRPPAAGFGGGHDIAVEIVCNRPPAEDKPAQSADEVVAEAVALVAAAGADGTAIVAADDLLTAALARDAGAEQTAVLLTERSRVRQQRGAGHLEWSLRDAQRALRLAGGDAEARLQLAVALAAESRYEEALEALDTLEASVGGALEKQDDAAEAAQLPMGGRIARLREEVEGKLGRLRDEGRAMRFKLDLADAGDAWKLMEVGDDRQVVTTAVDEEGTGHRVGRRGGPGGEEKAAGDVGGDGPNVVRVVCISDTHGQHRSLDIPDADILIHAGDITEHGELEQLEDFAAWLDTLPHKHKLVIAGNHDVTLAPAYYARRGAPRFHKKRPYDPVQCRAALEGSCTYLEDSGVVVEGVSVWGSPWQPRFFDWAFNVERGSESRGKWETIPTGGKVDVLITHGPPVGHGDNGHDFAHAGCVDLLLAIQRRVMPRAHVFGHIHDGYGATTDGHTLYVNAASCDGGYAPTNPPIVLNIEVEPVDEAANTETKEDVNDEAGGDTGDTGDTGEEVQFLQYHAVDQTNGKPFHVFCQETWRGLWADRGVEYPEDGCFEPCGIASLVMATTVRDLASTLENGVEGDALVCDLVGNLRDLEAMQGKVRAEMELLAAARVAYVEANGDEFESPRKRVEYLTGWVGQWEIVARVRELGEGVCFLRNIQCGPKDTHPDGQIYRFDEEEFEGDPSVVRAWLAEEVPFRAEDGSIGYWVQRGEKRVSLADYFDNTSSLSLPPVGGGGGWEGWGRPMILDYRSHFDVCVPLVVGGRRSLVLLDTLPEDRAEYNQIKEIRGLLRGNGLCRL